MPKYNSSILEYLENHDIQTWTKGKNVHVKKGAVAIQCPFCHLNGYTQDRSNHLQIYPNGRIRCWRCGEKNSTRLIRHIEGCGWDRAHEILEGLILDIPSAFAEEYDRPNSLVLPDEFTKELPRVHRRYLESRNFDPDFIQSEYSIMAAYNEGDYKFRVIIPLFLNGRMVHFTGRDITDKSSLRYQTCPDEEAVISMANLLYNIDSVRGDTVLIVEGATDVWRIGRSAVGIMTTEFTPGKALLLKDKGVKRVVTFYDPGAEIFAPELEAQLYWIEEIIHLNSEDENIDPADLSEEEARDVRKIVFGRNA